MAQEAALVAKRCQEAKETGIVNLSNCGLKDIPQALYFFVKNTDVTKLDISNNQLTRVPAKILKAFPLLVEFKCANNADISSLPEGFSALEHLSHVDLSQNRFTKLPFVGSSMKNLDLSGNMIQTVTQEEIENVFNLESIKLNNNPLENQSKYLLQKYANFILH
ncbi:unnamed protein product [Clavelina lepadiformis]|uniref:Leucine-rich repeat-containing protein 20 n=1 Tax=Clavelina lepadiformis TaxID=159417 RepID=A0ABP0H479_CLALP